MTVFDGRKAIWQWEFSVQAEKTIAQAALAARDLASAGILLVKVMDGLDWMSLYDPTGYDGLARLQADTASAAAAGVTLVPWVVPHGQDPLAEAAAHAQLGPVLMIDVEPYPGFWTGPIANLPVYLQALRAGGYQELHISVVPRPSALAALGGLAAFRDLVDGMHPQVYWTNFGQPALSVMPMIRSLMLAGGGGPPVYPALPGDGTAQDLDDIWSLAEAAGCPGVSVWRLGSMNAAQLANFKELPMTNPDLEARVTALEATVARLNEVLAKRFEGVRAALDPANPPT